MNLKNGKLFTSKYVWTGHSSYKKKRIYRAAVSQRLRNTALEFWFRILVFFLISEEMQKIYLELLSNYLPISSLI